MQKIFENVAGFRSLESQHISICRKGNKCFSSDIIKPVEPFRRLSSRTFRRVNNFGIYGISRDMQTARNPVFFSLTHSYGLIVRSSALCRLQAARAGPERVEASSMSTNQTLGTRSRFEGSFRSRSGHLGLRFWFFFLPSSFYVVIICAALSCCTLAVLLKKKVFIFLWQRA